MFDKIGHKESDSLLPKYSRRHADSFLNRANANRRPHNKDNCRRLDCPQCQEAKMRQYQPEAFDLKYPDRSGQLIPQIGAVRASSPPSRSSLRPPPQPLTPPRIEERPKVTIPVIPRLPKIPRIPPCLPHPPEHKFTVGQLEYQPVWVPDAENPTEANRSRTLVLCFDSSSDQLDVGDSNIIQFLSCLKKDDKKKQLVYYQTGTVTNTRLDAFSTVKDKISKTIDSLFAPKLVSDVQDGYRFLVQNYKGGDRISLFGFSRGAYIARALAGMVQRVGLLPADNTQQIPFAWSLYLRDDDDADRDRAAYKRTFSSDVTIDFVGVWETPFSVGALQMELPFARDNTSIRVFRHALALDEHRANFTPNFYHTKQSQSTTRPKAAAAAPALASSAASVDDAPLIDVSVPEPTSTSKSRKKAIEYPKKDRNAPTDVCEVWFAGCHGDVGGGYVKNGTPHSLARISLRWMIRECFRMRTGLIFDARMLQEELGMDWTTVYPEVKLRTPRKPANRNSVIEPMRPQGWGFISFIAFLISLLFIPIRIVLSVVMWPIVLIWLLFKYTTVVKLIRKYPVIWIRRGLGIDWTISKLKKIGAWFNRLLFPMASYVPERCRKPCMSEEDHEYWDALSPMHDRIQIRGFWKIMEYLPLHFVKQKGDRNDYYVAFNCGEGRRIYGDALRQYVVNLDDQPIIKSSANLWDAIAAAEAGQPSNPHTAGTYLRNGTLKIHRSVKTRVEVLGRNGRPAYKPRVWWFRRRDLGKGKKGRKYKGPDRWNIENPDPVKYWEWVD